MNKVQYQEYLQSSHWYQIRSKALENAEYSCQLCNSENALNVHHRTYDRIGHERLTDLIVLCRDCHAKFHDKLEDVEDTTFPRPDDGSLEWERDCLRHAADGGLARWIELAWYQLMLKMGLSASAAIESVSRELNGGGYHRHIDEDRRQ